MPSANLEKRPPAAPVDGRIMSVNTGQSCIAAKRFIFADSVYDAEQAFVERFKALKVGDPMDPATEIGPLATEQILTDLEAQVGRALAAGAKLLARRAKG